MIYSCHCFGGIVVSVLDKISHGFNYNDLKRFKEIGYYSALGLSWGTILTPWQADLVIIPVELALFILSFSLNSAKTRDVTNIREMYSEVVSDYAKMIKRLELKEPVEISAFFERSYRDGYLSRDKKFSFGDKKVRDIPTIFGSNIMTGEGVCRHIAYMLDDIYRDMGIDSNLLLVHMRKRILVPSVDMSKQGLTKEELYDFVDSTTISSEEREYAKRIIDEFIDIVGEHLSIDVGFEDVKGRPSPNHVVNFVVNDKKAFLIDPTNSCMLKLNRQDPRFLVDMVDPKILIDWPSYDYSRASSKKMKQAKKDILLPSTSFEEDVVTRKRIQTLFEENIDIVDYFYQKHNEAYHEISNELMKIKVKEKKKKRN